MSCGIRTSFPLASAKGNDASSGSKGDYIFKDKDEEDEIVSIIFKMNENDTTATKKKEQVFWVKTRSSGKGCEYAVLVSLLSRITNFIIQELLMYLPLSKDVCDSTAVFHSDNYLIKMHR